MEASKASTDPNDKKLREGLAETFYGKATSLRPSRSSAAAKQKDDEDAKKKVVPIAKPTLTFKDVGGLDDVKEEIRKAIVYPMQHPELFKMYGKKTGEAILLYGPPGCGKTFIVKAAAGECNVAFITMKISEILSKYLGESEQNIGAAFSGAKDNAPSLLFFDEVDAIGGRRDDSSEGYSKRIVNQLLVEMDGVEGLEGKQVLLLAGTNAPWDVDPALRRPGRFSKLLFLPPPDPVSRKAIFKIYMRDLPIEEHLNLEALVAKTDGYSAADVEQICLESADIPLAEALSGKPPRKINMGDFEQVISKRTSSITPWFRLALQQVEKSDEADLFKPLVDVCKKYAGR